MPFPNISDNKCAWLLASPSRYLGISIPEFKDALSAHLCLLSPAVRDGGWVDKAVGSQGDEITYCTEIAGDSWRNRHDVVKRQIVEEAALAGVQWNCEGFGLFYIFPAALLEPGGKLQYRGDSVR